MRLALVLAAIGLCIGVSCALGTERDPGCRNDGDCDEGFVCRDGACFRFTTSASPPTDPQSDAGADASDAATD